MPFHKYSSRTAKSLFTATPTPASRSQPASSQDINTQSNDGKAVPATDSLKDRLDRTRALIQGIQKERYKSDLARSRMDVKEAAKARIEAAQRAALDEELRTEALEELRKQQLPIITRRLERDLRPKVQESLRAELRAELQPKVHAELRAELVGELTDRVWAELQEHLRDEVEENLRLELEETLADSVRDKLYHDLYPEVIAQLKDEYRDMVLLQLKDEVAAEELTRDAIAPIVNGQFEDALDPALMEQSEASDTGLPPSELAVLAKRRFSEGFEDEDPETRTKKLKMMNHNEDSISATKSLLLPGNLSRSNGSGAGQIDESLDEGEKADIEDGSGIPLVKEAAEKTTQQAVVKAARDRTPGDVNADAGDELSDKDLARSTQPDDQDADAKMETEADEIPLPVPSMVAQSMNRSRQPTPNLHLENKDTATEISKPGDTSTAYDAPANNKITIDGITNKSTQAESSTSSSHSHDKTASQSSQTSSPRTHSWTHVDSAGRQSFSIKTLPENSTSTSKPTAYPNSPHNHTPPSEQESSHANSSSDSENENDDSDAIHQGFDSDDMLSEGFSEDIDREPIDRSEEASGNEDGDEDEDEDADQSDEADEEMDGEEEDDSNVSSPSMDPTSLHTPYARLPSYTNYSQGGNQDDPIALDSD